MDRGRRRGGGVDAGNVSSGGGTTERGAHGHGTADDGAVCGIFGVRAVSDGVWGASGAVGTRPGVWRRSGPWISAGDASGERWGSGIVEHAHAGDKRKTQHGGTSSRVKVGTTTGTSTKKKNATSKAHKTKERRVCVNCKSTETPFWRKGKDGVGSLCNACGLYLAKNDAHRPPLLLKRSSSASEINGSDRTAETTQRIMDEGRDVNDAQPSADDVQTESAPVTTTATVVVNEALNQDISQDERKMMISAVESVKKDAQGGAEK